MIKKKREKVINHQHSNHHQLIAPNSTPLEVSFKYLPHIRRTAIYVEKHFSPNEYKSRKCLCNALVKLIGRYVHPNIYGTVEKRDSEKCILRVLDEKINHKKYILRLDLRKAFFNVDLFRLRKLLKKYLGKAGLSVDAIEGMISAIFRNYQLKGEKSVAFRGLAQGDMLSSFLFSIYMTPIFERFSRRFKAFGYVDDNHVVLDSSEAKDEAIRYFNECLGKHGYIRKDKEGNVVAKRQLFLNEKKTELSAPDENTHVLGMIINKRGLLLPAEGRSISTHIERVSKILAMASRENSAKFAAVLLENQKYVL